MLLCMGGLWQQTNFARTVHQDQSVSHLEMIIKSVCACIQSYMTTLQTCRLFEYKIMNKCSTVAEMGDRLATIDMGRPKICFAHFFGGGSWVPI